MKERLALIISHVSDPLVTFPFFLAVMVFKSGLISTQVRTLLSTLFIINFVIPGIYFIFAFRKHWISDWEITKREERLLPYGVFLLCWFVGLIVVHTLGNDLLLNLGLTFYLVAFIGTIITVFWKISVHVAGATCMVLVLDFLFNWRLPWLYLIIPLVAWARWQRRKHTISQLMGGFLLSLAVVLLSLRLFGYL